jgi:hypothetical protein
MQRHQSQGVGIVAPTEAPVFSSWLRQDDLATDDCLSRDSSATSPSDFSEQVCALHDNG